MLYKNPPPPQKIDSSSTFGIISIVVGVLGFFAPKLFISMILMALAIFVILGFIKDGSKGPAVIGMLLGFFIFYLLTQEELNKSKPYNVEYRVQCYQCDVSFTNETGGTDEATEVGDNWSKYITVKGGEYLTLHARSRHGDIADVRAEILVNNVVVESKTSSGKYASVILSCTPANP